MTGTAMYAESQWLRNTLLDLIGIDDWTCKYDPALGIRGALIVYWSGGPSAIPEEILDSRDPIDLIDRFRCAVCGKFHKQPSSMHAYVTVIGDRKRIVCEGCFYE